MSKTFRVEHKVPQLVTDSLIFRLLRHKPTRHTCYKTKHHIIITLSRTSPKLLEYFLSQSIFLSITPFTIRRHDKNVTLFSQYIKNPGYVWSLILFFYVSQKVPGILFLSSSSKVPVIIIFFYWVSRAFCQPYLILKWTLHLLFLSCYNFKISSFFREVLFSFDLSRIPYLFPQFPKGIFKFAVLPTPKSNQLIPTWAIIY